jgi:hypothetical protein
MWLINTDSYGLEYFSNTQFQPYAILSHMWEDEEIDFHEMKSGADISHKKGYQKVISCCKQAKEDGYKYAWVDTCW